MLVQSTVSGSDVGQTNLQKDWGSLTLSMLPLCIVQNAIKPDRSITHWAGTFHSESIPPQISWIIEMIDEVNTAATFSVVKLWLVQMRAGSVALH